MKTFLMGLAAAGILAAATQAKADFPEREVLGVVMWGAGGATDTVARAVNPAAEEALGKPIVVPAQAPEPGPGAVADEGPSEDAPRGD